MISVAPSNRVAALSMVAATVFIALSTLLAKGVAGQFELDQGAADIHPLQVTAARFLVGAVIWSIIFGVRRPSVTTIHWQLHIARSFFGWLTVTCIFWAASLMVLSDAMAISFLTPVFTLVIAALVLKEQLRSYRVIAVLVMLAGALILLRPGTSAFEPAAFIALVAAFASSVEATLIKRLVGLEPRLQVLLVNNLVGVGFAVAAASLVWVWPSLVQWSILVAVGVSMAGAQVLFLTSLRSGEASYVVPFMYSTLIFASVLDFVVFGDAPDTLGAIGAAIIVLGAIYLAVIEGRRNA